MKVKARGEGSLSLPLSLPRWCTFDDALVKPHPKLCTTMRHAAARVNGSRAPLGARATAPRSPPGSLPASPRFPPGFPPAPPGVDWKGKWRTAGRARARRGAAKRRQQVGRDAEDEGEGCARHAQV